ncbi:MAG TPA: cytochrome c3 family protein [Verrucomicrobiae bacterium]|nr:cytochrome c3 family protein [Verrucomicrobiae bacterium]
MKLLRPLTFALFLAAAVVAYFSWRGVEAKFTLPASSIIFDHKKHVQEFGLDCSHCHAAAESEEAADLLLPEEELCLTCHNGQVASKECSLCHRDVKDTKTYPPHERKTIFSHKRHVEHNINCLTCHPGSDAKEVLTAAQMPEMQTCFGCHDGASQSSECELCHSDAKTLRRLMHPAGFSHAHKFAAGLDASACAPCHRQEENCLACHRGDNLLGSTHPVNYLYSHPLDVKAKRADCQSCHEVESFCVSCHRAEAVQPLSHSAPNWTVTLSGVPSRHAIEARRDAEYCLSCHQSDEPTCASAGCHDN